MEKKYDGKPDYSDRMFLLDEESMQTIKTEITFGALSCVARFSLFPTCCTTVVLVQVVALIHILSLAGGLPCTIKTHLCV